MGLITYSGVTFAVGRDDMYYYVGEPGHNANLRSKCLTKVWAEGNDIHLEGEGCNGYDGNRKCTVSDATVRRSIIRMWESLQAGKLCGWFDTDGDHVSFQLDGRYVNYLVDGKPKVKHLSKLELTGNTYHLDGLSTGWHASARVSTVPGNVTGDDREFPLKLFKERPTFCVFCIGSAGHGSGSAKGESTKDDAGLLDTKDDIEDCKKWVAQKINSSYEFFGSYEVSGGVGSAESCKAELANFFLYCKERNVLPCIYYTGHGDTDGDWCFRNGGRVTFQDVKDRNVSGWRVTIWSDCCYSGKWAEKSAGSAQVIAAANKDKKAINRVFARAVFRNSGTDQSRLYSSSIDAISNDFDQSSTSHFRVSHYGPRL